MAVERVVTRRNLFRYAAAGAVVASGALAGCSRTGTADSGAGGQGLLKQAKERGYLTVGFAGEAPYAYKEGGDLTGQDPAVHREIWTSLGIKELRGVQVEFGQLIPGLNAKRFDVVAAGMFILPERCAQAKFSAPVYVAPQAFLVPAGNPKQITDFPSVAKSGITLGVLPGSVEASLGKKQGVTKTVEVASQRDGLSALKANRIQAFALTSISLRNMLKDNPNSGFELTEPFTPVVDGKEQIGAGGAVFRNESDELRMAFDRELAKLRSPASCWS
ncbi:transporter substrate-binding domain-containing protein [Micromonospora zhanjiangensis]